MGCCLGWCRDENNLVNVEVSPLNPIEEDTKKRSTLSTEFESVRVRLLSYNLFMRPPGIKTNESDHKDLRLQEFSKRIKNYDVIALQEMFGSFSNRRETLIQLAAAEGFKYAVTAPRPPCCVFVDGGLVILSKLPIVACDWLRYPRGTLAGGDALAEKGALYCMIEAETKTGQKVYFHLVNTHLQASYQDPPGSKSFRIRSKQITKLKRFINQKTQNDNYPIFIVGDFNVNGRVRGQPPDVDSQEYLDLLEDFQSNDYAMYDLLKLDAGFHPVTYGDVEEHDPTIPRETALTHKKDYFSQQRLDYIMLMLKHEQEKLFYEISDKKKTTSEDADEKALLRSLTNETKNSVIVRIQKGLTHVAPFFIQHSKVTQLSDHYGVETTVDFVVPMEENSQAKRKQRKNTKNEHPTPKRKRSSDSLLEK